MSILIFQGNLPLFQGKSTAGELGSAILSTDDRIKSFLTVGDKAVIGELKELSKEVKQNSNFKNVKIELIDKLGQTLYRNWTDDLAGAHNAFERLRNNGFKAYSNLIQTDLDKVDLGFFA